MSLNRKGFSGAYLILFTILMADFLTVGWLILEVRQRTDPIPPVLKNTNDGSTEEILP